MKQIITVPTECTRTSRSRLVLPFNATVLQQATIQAALRIKWDPKSDRFGIIFGPLQAKTQSKVTPLNISRKKTKQVRMVEQPRVLYRYLGI